MTDNEEFPPLIDVSNDSIPELLEGNPSLRKSIKRLVRTINEEQGVISAFSSFVQ